MEMLTTKEKWIVMIVALIIIGGAGFIYAKAAGECADKGGRYLIGGKYDYPVCVKEL